MNFKHTLLKAIFTAAALLLFLIQMGCTVPTQTAFAVTPSATAMLEPTPEPIPSQTPSPAPSPTPKPTATLRPTSAPPEILFEEYFDDETTCLTLRSLSSDVTLGIENGEYRIRVDGDNSFDTRCTRNFDNFVMEFDLTLVDRGVQSLFGLMFRINDGSSYNVYISGSDNFCWDYYNLDLNRYRNLAGCWVELLNPIEEGQAMQLRLVAANEKMAFQINGDTTALISDTSGSSGAFGFFVVNNGEGTTEVQIDNIVIRELSTPDLDIFRFDQTGN